MLMMCFFFFDGTKDQAP
nr:hypothetical protein [Sicyoidochytrium minutum DNA virus]